MHISGVDEVMSFDEESVVLGTSFGNLNVEGDGLHMTLLDLEKGEVALDGIITGLYYTKPREKGAKLFTRKRGT